MSLTSLLSQTVTVHPYEQGAEDDYGTPTVDFGEGVDYPARLEQTDALEVTTGRDTVLSDWRLFLPADADIGPYDLVVADGQSFEVIGPPNLHRTPRGPHHIEARLRSSDIEAPEGS